MAVRVAAKSSEIQILCGILKLFLDLRRVSSMPPRITCSCKIIKIILGHLTLRFIHIVQQL